jgi:phosphoglycolate phosphatase
MNVIIFDFDGTIANTLKLADQVYLELSTRYQLKAFTKAEIHELKHLSYKERLKMHHISVFKLPRMIRRTRKIVSKIILNAGPFPEIKALIESLIDEGYIISIVSSNSKKNIESFLNHHNFPPFQDILGNASFFGKDKLLKKLMKKYQGSKFLYVGDETRDIISTKEVSCPMVAVTWGYDEAHMLEKAEPDYCVHDTKDLRHVITSHFMKGK